MEQSTATSWKVVCAAIALGARVSAQSPDPPPIPVDQEPRHHIVFADERLRVLEVSIAVGDTTLEHRHDHDLVTVNVENGPTRTKDRGADWGSVRPRAIGGVNVNEYTGKATAHVVQSVGDRPYRLTGVENLAGVGRWTTLGPIAGPYLAVVSESRAFRAYELRLPAATTVMHTHQVPVVAVLVEGAVTMGSADNRVLTVPGAWSVFAGGSAHVLTTAAATHVVELEVR